MEDQKAMDETEIFPLIKILTDFEFVKMQLENPCWQLSHTKGMEKFQNQLFNQLTSNNSPMTID